MGEADASAPERRAARRVEAEDSDEAPWTTSRLANPRLRTAVALSAGLALVFGCARLGRHAGSAARAAASQADRIVTLDAADCEDPKHGTKCYDAVAWVLQTGIYEHPEWFPGLDKEARFEEIQAQLVKDDPGKPEDERSKCKAPCKDPAKAKRYKGIPGSSLDLPVPGPYAERQDLEFYAYRAQGDSDYPLENVDIGDLPGVMWYLHNEIVVAVGRARKYNVTRIRRFKVKMTTTWAYYNSHRRQFGAFVAFDSGHCTVPGCSKIWERFGAIPGCQHVDTERLRAAYMSDIQTFIGEDCEGYKCRPPVWYSLPGPCPDHNYEKKTSQCKADYPGGLCDSASGERDCTYSVENMGEVTLDVVTGIDDYVTFFEDGGIEYTESRDAGVKCDFWNGKHDEDKCKERVDKVKQLFDEKYPDMPKCDDLPSPPCDTDGYFPNELESSLTDWPVHEEALDYGTFGKIALGADGASSKASTSSGGSTAKASTTTKRPTTTSEAEKTKSTTKAGDEGGDAPGSQEGAHKLDTKARSEGEEDDLGADSSYSITLDHSGKEMLGLAFTMVDEAIVVDGVTGGLFGKWNEEHPDLRVQRGDLIVGVNGVRGGSLRLAEELKRPRELKVELQALEPHPKPKPRSRALTASPAAALLLALVSAWL